MVLVSSEAKHYKRAIAIIAKAKVKTPLAGALILTLRLYRPQKSGDLSNRIKVLEDALQGVCYTDDNQIIEIHASRHDDKDNPRVELSIALAPEDDSQPLLALEP
jgi:Holliday junction resolvase RusA-like endonuclease